MLVQQLRAGKPLCTFFYELLALEQSGLVPNSVTFNAAIIACEKGHRWENALNLMHEMHLRRLELDLITCNAVVNTCSYGRQGWDSIGQTSESKICCHVALLIVNV